MGKDHSGAKPVNASARPIQRDCAPAATHWSLCTVSGQRSWPCL